MSHRRRLSLVWFCGLAITACASAAVVLYAHRARSTDRANSGSEPKPLMDEAQREYLWDIEHHGLLLSRQGFAKLTDALSRADEAALSSLLAADFRGESLSRPRELRVARDFATVVRQEETGATPERLNRRQFVARLLQYRAPFSKPPKVQFALMGLRPAEEDLHGPWQGTGQLRLSGEMGRGRPREVILYLRYRVAQPTKRALRGPGWVHRAAITQVQTAQAPHFLMHEVATQRGIDVRRFHDNWRDRRKGSPETNTGGVYLCDFNRDGLLDMLITDTNGAVLYQGLPGGSFRDVTSEVLPEVVSAKGSHALLAAFVDLDGDGWEDLILGDHIYRNEEGQRFIDYTAMSNLLIPPDATGVAVADFDRDGLMDLYVTRPGKAKSDSWLSGTSGDPTRGNQLFRNKGHWQFENVTARSGTAGGNRSTFTAVWLDADNDGWPDLYVINEFGNGVLLINQHDGTFKEHPLVQGPGDFGSMGVTCGDIDNDGNIDLYVGNMYSKAGKRVIGNVRPGTYPDDITAKLHSFVAGSQLWRNRGGLNFEPQGKKLQVNSCGWAYGPALADLDNDGWLDLYATAGFISQDRNQPDG